MENLPQIDHIPHGILRPAPRILRQTADLTLHQIEGLLIFMANRQERRPAVRQQASHIKCLPSAPQHIISGLPHQKTRQ
jgi:hypothetical protein